MTPTLSRNRHPVPLSGALLVAACLSLSACSSDDDAGANDIPAATPEVPDTTGAPDPLDGTRYAFVSGSTPVTFDAGQIERFELRTATGDTEDAELALEVVSTGTTVATGSDIRVATDERDLYQIGRFQIDSLTRYAPDDLDAPIWQYSVNGTETAANPYEVVFASETKAYVIRYGSPLVWIVDPSSSTEANFKIGEIDLSAYDTVDGVPNASDAILVNGRLFVLLQRLDEFAPVRDGYVAVIDTATDTEVDTGMGSDGLFGIALESSNPATLSYVEENEEIYVVGRGNIFGNADVAGDPYDGGVEVIDPVSFERDLLLDDGTAEDNDGFVADALVVSPDKGYVLYYTEFGVTTLRTFNPMTGLPAEDAVAGLENRDISVLAQDPDGRLWVGLSVGADGTESPGFTVLDPRDDSVLIERVATEFNPNDIVFVDVPAESGTNSVEAN